MPVRRRLSLIACATVLAASCSGSPSSSTTGVSVSTTAVTFPTTAVGGSATASVTVSTTADATIGIADTDTADFPYTTNCTVSMPAATSCVITVQFHPAVANTLSAWLTINSSLGKNAVQLTGTATGGAAPSAGVSPVTLIEIATSLTNPFYMTAGQTQQLAATALLSSGGTQNVTSTSAWTSSDATVATVSPGGLITAVGIGNASVWVTYQGRSTAIGVLVAGNITVSPSSMTFAGTSVGQTTPATFQVTFAGPNQLASISSSNPSEFGVSTTCDTTDGHTTGYKCTFAVTFAPAATGPRSAQITLASAVAPGTGSTITVSGTGQ